MISLYCPQDGRRLKIHQKDVHLLEMDHNPHYISADPNIIWQGQVLICPACGLKVVLRNSGGFTAAAFEKGFDETLERIRSAGEPLITIYPEL